MCIICRKEYNVNLTILNCSNCQTLTSIPELPNLTILNCSNCKSLTSIPNLPSLTELDCSNCKSLTNVPNLSNLIRLYCSNCPLLKSVPKSLTSLTHLECFACPLLTTIPNNNFRYINKSNCKWLNPSNNRLNKLILIQRKCKKYIQKRRETIILSLIPYLPREVILYCIL